MIFESEEQVEIQTLVTLPFTTPPPSRQTLQRLSTQDTPLHISRPSLRTPQSVEATSFKDVSLDEVIVLPMFDLITITLEEMNILQEALQKKKS